MELLKKGAEAELYLIDWFGCRAVKKIRIAKNYRVKELDLHLRRYRTSNEAKLLINVKKIKIPVPSVFDVDLNEFSITMEFLNGVPLKELMPQLNIEELREIFSSLGNIVGLMHENGFFHGDLTTSNVILVGQKLFLIDFGLGGMSKEIEFFGVDIHLLLRALESTHHELSQQCFQYFRDGYIASFSQYKVVFNKVNEIRKRGRYVLERRIRALNSSLYFKE